MNYLTICQTFARKVGIPTSGFLTAVNPTSAELTRVVGWVDEAWNEIQTLRDDWHWMRESTSWVTSSGGYSYALGTGAGTVGITADTFGKWCTNDGVFRNYPTASGNASEIMMDFEPDYDTWRNLYLLSGTRSTRTRPHTYAIAPDKSILLGPVPDSGYTVTADYFSAPTAMTQDNEIPAIPARYHYLLIYRAMMLYGEFESAPEVYGAGERGWSKMWAALESDQLDRVFAGAALA